LISFYPAPHGLFAAADYAIRIRTQGLLDAFRTVNWQELNIEMNKLSIV
jgi:hypothetical protein